ncbi:MAG: hypothetical protein ACI9EF_001313 [Pseudohongiellaceae bacterium]|jgi:hypothetical protein
MAGFGLLVVVFLSIHAFRRSLPYVLPIAGIILALITMDEFHTMGDLVVTARSWITAALAFAGWTLILAGPLLRTDMGGTLLPKARLVGFLASLPGYAAAFFIFTRTPLAGTQQDLMAVGLALLAGGTVQSLLLSLLSKSAEVEDRVQDDFPWVEPRDIGIALMPLTMPLLAVVAFSWVRLPASFAALAIPSAWAGLLVLSLIIPAIPAAGLVGSALDRVDGRSRGRTGVVVAGLAFALWFVFGPLTIEWLYAASGPLDSLRAAFPTGGPWVARSGEGGHAALGGMALGGSLTLYGVPAADIVRGGTLMMLGVSALSARYLRHAEDGLVGVGFGTMTIAWVLQILCCFCLISKLGPTGAALGTAAACLVMLAVDVLTGERSEYEDEAEYEERVEKQSELLPGPEGY